ncbi:hypothetical protein HYZ97_02295 [Candidatus Pacearchaeota archaeon]|nr:hypothetical protein [Candidatus Pacearchaeota archaeon]
MTKVTVSVYDLETGNVEEREIPECFPGLVYGCIYRNKSTRSLDVRFGQKLSLTTHFLPPLTQGHALLSPLARAANLIGHYFGVQKAELGRSALADLSNCIQQGLVEVVNDEGTEVVLPKDFR